MSEFRIHHHVSELLSLLGVSAGDGPEVYTEMLTRNMTPYVTTQVSAHTSKSKIAESSQTPREFLKKYDELKSKNVRELDPLVYLLSKVVDDRQMMSFFERNSKTRSRARLNALKGGKASVQAVQDAIPPAGTMTPQELSELRSQLATASNVTIAGITPEEKLKLLREKQSKRAGNIPGAPSWVVE
ncbi:gamma-tubulin complex component 2, partial [Exaiptasia diaphana]|uniref:Uncharacterized protein n=1 Tax=Exaiptasia diaphana TaxID=2652724 RepID=A0A913WYH8_EXADI